jgi:hypothetical protein
MLNPIRILRSLYIIAIAFSIFATGAAHSQDLGPLDKALRAAGYRLYNPPRANWGPGFVFTGDVLDGKITNVREICPNLYADLEAPQSAAVLLPNFDAKDSFSFGIAIRFLKNLLGLDADLEKMQREQSISVKWSNLRETSYTDVDKWLETGEPRPIARRCRSAIEDLRARKQFEDKVFIIVRAVSPETLLYDFDSAIEVKGSASAEAWQQGKLKAEGKAEIKNRTQLETKEKLFVGYAPPVKLQEWTPSGLVSGEIIGVRGQPTALSVE